MRAIAVLGVVIYHLRPSWLPGGFAGVDVFFVLSGFFITGLLLREGRRSGRVDLLAFWGRRARRLLPAAGLVLVLTVVASAVLATALDARRFAIDAAYATVFSVNWRFAAQGDSYLADPEPSPITHFWSLGVEEQFYLVWPILLLGLALVARRRLARAVFGLAVVAGGVSFAVALRLTTTDQPYAYFATYSRVWQLALGAAVAAVAVSTSRRGMPVPARILLRWAGVGAIVSFYVLAPRDVVYPGWIALVPTLGAVAVVAAGLGAAPDREPLGRLLSTAPAQLLGRYSYGWYLWHWPPLVLLPLALGHRLSGLQLLGVAGLTLLAAIGSYHLVEHPLRSSRVLARRHGLPSLALGLAVVLVGGGVAVAATRAANNDLAHSSVASSAGELVPQPGPAAAQVPQPSRDGCQRTRHDASTELSCRYLPDRGHGDVVLVGDSHATQWFPAVEDIARSRGWGLRVWTRESCPLAGVTKQGDGPDGRYVVCNAWRDKVMRTLIASPPSLVVTVGFASRPSAIWDDGVGRFVVGPRALALEKRGFETELTRLRDARVPVLLIGDNPSYAQSGPKCALQFPEQLRRCSSKLRNGLHGSVDLQAARSVPGVRTLDLTSRFCPDRRCRQILGRVLAYRDDNHLTAEAVRVFRPELERAMRGALRSGG